MKIVARAFWDEEARVWVAVGDNNIGLVTEADTIEQLLEKLPVMAAELLELNPGETIDVELISSASRRVEAA